MVQWATRSVEFDRSILLAVFPPHAGSTQTMQRFALPSGTDLRDVPTQRAHVSCDAQPQQLPDMWVEYT